jgi:hypothetical protein
MSSSRVGQDLPQPEMGGFQGSLLQGLLVCQAMGDAFQVAFLGEVMLEPVTATARGILARSGELRH